MSRIKRYIRAAGILLIGFGAVQAVSASPFYYCKDGPIDLVNDGCVSGEASGYPGGGDGIYSNTGGGDSKSAVEAAILGATGSAVDIMLYGKSDDSSSVLFDITGSLGGSIEDNVDGTWDVLDDLISIAYITVKAANSFALYDVQGANDGTWTTAGLLTPGQNGNQPDLSHLSFWTANETVQVPEPGTLGLLGLGMLGLMTVRRKTQKSA